MLRCPVCNFESRTRQYTTDGGETYIKTVCLSRTCHLERLRRQTHADAESAFAKLDKSTKWIMSSAEAASWHSIVNVKDTRRFMLFIDEYDDTHLITVHKTGDLWRVCVLLHEVPFIFECYTIDSMYEALTQALKT